MPAFNNTKTDEELDELFDKIVNRLSILEKLIETVDKTEQERINNVIDSIRFVLDYFALDKNVNYSDSDSKKILLILNLVIQKEVD